MSKKRIFFNWDFPVTPLQYHSWNDGLSMALRILGHKYDVEIYPSATQDTKAIYEGIDTTNPDLILCWGSLDRPSFGAIKQFNKPTALCFAGGEIKHGNRKNFDVIFVENQEYVDNFAKIGTSVKRAFGVNEALFMPTIKLHPHFKAIYPAAFIAWKRHNLFAEAVGETGLAVGVVDEISKEAMNSCFQFGTMVVPEVPYEVLPFLISQSETVVITASAGSQRTVLEAMAMNRPVIVMEDNNKNCEYVRESGVGLIVKPEVEAIREAILKKDSSNHMAGRNYIVENYSAEKYADDLWKEIKELI